MPFGGYLQHEDLTCPNSRKAPNSDICVFTSARLVIPFGLIFMLLTQRPRKCLHINFQLVIRYCSCDWANRNS